MKNRYEFVEGSSKKFWEIELNGDSFTTWWGRIGTNGQEKTQDFDSKSDAKKAYDKLVAEKVKKGYKLVASEGDASPATAPTSFPENKALEDAICANRTDTANWQVYADWLLEQGVEWGATIAQSCAGKSTASKQNALKKQWLAGDPESKISWKYGVIEQLDLHPESAEEDGTRPMADVLLDILNHPAGRLLRSMHLGLPPSGEDDDGDWHFGTIFEAIPRVGKLPLLEELDMTRDARHMDQDSWRSIGDMSKLWPCFPRLKTLRMKGSSGTGDDVPLKLGNIEAPLLETLVIQSSGLSKSALIDIGASALPMLNHLELWIGQEDYGNTCKIKHFEKIFEGQFAPKLVSLGICNSEWEQDLIGALAKAPLLSQLRKLDLSKGILCKKGVKALVKFADQFAHLEEINLDENYISDQDGKALKKALPNIKLGSQREPDGDPDDKYSRYCAVGE